MVGVFSAGWKPGPQWQLCGMVRDATEPKGRNDLDWSSSQRFSLKQLAAIPCRHFGPTAIDPSVLLRLEGFGAWRHDPVTARTASLILATAKCPIVSKSTCGRFGILSAATTASTIAGPSTANASLIAASSSPGFLAAKP